MTLYGLELSLTLKVGYLMHPYFSLCVLFLSKGWLLSLKVIEKGIQ